MSLLAARISVSNLHKCTPNAFSKTIEKLYNYILPQSGERSPLVSDDVYNIVMEVGFDAMQYSAGPRATAIAMWNRKHSEGDIMLLKHSCHQWRFYFKHPRAVFPVVVSRFLRSFVDHFQQQLVDCMVNSSNSLPA